MNERIRKTGDREALLGYVFDALEEAEREALDARLRHDSELREELARIREAVAPLELLKQEVAVPQDLAARTCQYVFERAATPRDRAAARRFILGPLNVHWADALVAGALLVAAVCVLFPAIQSSRLRSQLVACQDNLRDIGTALTRFSESHGGYFPTVPTKGRLAAAGIYAPKLVSDKLLTESQRLCCPGSSLQATELPRLDDLESASEKQLAKLLPTLGGSYGYSLGHLVDGVYRDTKNLYRPTFALVADLPSPSLPHRQSLHHAGRGENVLYEDGHVQFLAESRPTGLVDDIYANDLGAVAAGTHPDDAVIVPSATPPLPPVR